MFAFWKIIFFSLNFLQVFSFPVNDLSYNTFNKIHSSLQNNSFYTTSFQPILQNDHIIPSTPSPHLFPQQPLSTQTAPIYIRNSIDEPSKNIFLFTTPTNFPSNKILFTETSKNPFATSTLTAQKLPEEPHFVLSEQIRITPQLPPTPNLTTPYNEELTLNDEPTIEEFSVKTSDTVEVPRPTLLSVSEEEVVVQTCDVNETSVIVGRSNELNKESKVNKQKSDDQWKLFWVNATNEQASLDSRDVTTTQTQVILSIPPPHYPNQTFACLVQDPSNNNHTVKVFIITEIRKNAIPELFSNLQPENEISPIAQTSITTSTTKVQESQNATKQSSQTLPTTPFLTETIYHQPFINQYFTESTFFFQKTSPPFETSQAREQLTDTYPEVPFATEVATTDPPHTSNQSPINASSKEAVVVAEAVIGNKQGKIHENKDLARKRLVAGIGLSLALALIATALVLYRKHKVSKKSTYITFGNPSFSRENLPSNEYSIESPLTLSSNGYTVLA